MQRTRIFLAALLAGAVSVSAAAAAIAVAQDTAAAPAAHTARAAKVTLRHTRLGNILATSSGFTLYEFTHDRGPHNSCVSIRECSGTWPPYTTVGRPSAGPGVRASLLSSIRIPGGKTQVAYAGHPLYLYSGDSRPGETSYVGESAFGGRWYALNSAGGTVR
jgi:predicted lipoprotein with Yx(FWY)xxD motif